MIIDLESRENRIRAFFLKHKDAEAMAAKMLKWDPPFDAGSWLTVRKGRATGHLEPYGVE